MSYHIISAATASLAWSMDPCWIAGNHARMNVWTMFTWTLHWNLNKDNHIRESASVKRLEGGSLGWSDGIKHYLPLWSQQAQDPFRPRYFSTAKHHHLFWTNHNVCMWSLTLTKAVLLDQPWVSGFCYQTLTNATLYPCTRLQTMWRKC